MAKLGLTRLPKGHAPGGVPGFRNRRRGPFETDIYTGFEAIKESRLQTSDSCSTLRA